MTRNAYLPGLVSVIVPAFNTGPFIRQALDSVLYQTYRDFEIIVVNDGSPDSDLLEAQISPLRAHVRYIRQDNRGLAGARASGLSVARGMYFALLDSDDWWYSDFLLTLVGELSEHEACAVAFPDALFEGDTFLAGKRYFDVCTAPPTREATLRGLVSRSHMVWGGVVGRRAAVDAVGGYDVDLRSAEDLDLWLRLLLAGWKIRYVPRLLAHYRIRKDSLSVQDTAITKARRYVIAKTLAERRSDLTRTLGAEMVAEIRSLDGDLWILAMKEAISHRRSRDIVCQLVKSPWHATFLLSRYLRRVADMIKTQFTAATPLAFASWWAVGHRRLPRSLSTERSLGPGRGSKGRLGPVQADGAVCGAGDQAGNQGRRENGRRYRGLLTAWPCFRTWPPSAGGLAPFAAPRPALSAIYENDPPVNQRTCVYALFSSRR